MTYMNALEPENLIAHFIQYPPQDFHAWRSAARIPFFSTHFDLLTTLDSEIVVKIKKLPFYSLWKGCLQPQTCFVGTTVSEYVPLTASLTADSLAMQIKQQYASSFPFIIVKDIALESPLQTTEANQYSALLVAALKKLGFIALEGQALAFVVIDFDNIETYLARFSYKRRKNFRRKLKSRHQFTIKLIEGGDTYFNDDRVLTEFYQMYLNVYWHSDVHFDLLSNSFFATLLRDKRSQVKIFCYWSQGRLIGYNICMIFNNMLIDKYVGFIYPEAKNFNLYYVSWFHNLEYACQHRLTKYIAGCSKPDVKASLGAQFTFTTHLVYIRQPIIRALLRKLSHWFEGDRRILAAMGKERR